MRSKTLPLVLLALCFTQLLGCYNRYERRLPAPGSSIEGSPERLLLVSGDTIELVDATLQVSDTSVTVREAHPDLGPSERTIPSAEVRLLTVRELSWSRTFRNLALSVSAVGGIVIGWIYLNL